MQRTGNVKRRKVQKHYSHGKSRDSHAGIHCNCQDVIVLVKPFTAESKEPELGNESDNGDGEHVRDLAAGRNA